MVVRIPMRIDCAGMAFTRLSDCLPGRLIEALPGALLHSVVRAERATKAGCSSANASRSETASPN